MAGIDPGKLIIYPPVLTNKDWQKKKGLGGKMTKTGLGAVLEKTEGMHKKIDWMSLDPNSLNPKTQAALDKAVVDAKAYYKRMVIPFQTQLQTLQNAAKKASATLAKTKTGKSAGKAASVIAKSADQFYVSTKSIDLDALIAKRQAQIAKLNDQARQKMAGALQKWAVGQKAYLSSGQTNVEWDRLMKQAGRSVSNCVKQDAAYNKEFWRDFEKFKGFDTGTLGLTEDDELTIKKRAKIVELANAQVKKIAAFKPG